ncbi:oligoribonuclease [Neptunomonas sp.]|uniref:oligoribonuclease n=1 Tax=Neptunomonas sp. TaxID=1971898 RepID=UPI0025FECD35|nr:oligoribonuclease [Neptunomonas sp.]
MSRKDNLIWIDLEMTGLDPDTDYIIEIATIVTDANLNVLAEGPSLVIHQPEMVMDNMNEWCVKQHGKSGLTQRVHESNVTEREAEQQTIAFIAEYVDKGASPICGNSIGQDRRFLHRYMPELENYFHYRNLDVSTIKELARRWKPELLSNFKKQGSHLAMDDIRDSIAELQHYRANFFRE